MIREKNFEDYKKAADYIGNIIGESPEIAIILGTGLGDILDEMEDKVTIPYKEVPNFLESTVEGHRGEFIYGKIYGKKVICMSGRFHYYEGYDESELAFPIYVLKLLGVSYLILTNAAGAINLDYQVGDICLIKDHINLHAISPQRGKNLDDLGPRYFPMDSCYDKDLRDLAKKVAMEDGIYLREGVYYYAVGPQFETPAEIRAMRLLGADTVGMSTVTEAITAAHCGIRTLALSLQTNLSADRSFGMDGSEVNEAAGAFSKNVKTVILGLIKEL